MKKVFLSLLYFVVLANTVSLHGQQVTFKKRIDNGSSNLGLSVAEVDSGYIVIGSGVSELDPTFYVKMFRTDFLGNITKFSEYGEAGIFWNPGSQGSITKTSDGNFVTGGAKDLGGSFHGLIIKFDSNLDTIWTKVFPSTSYLPFYQCRETPDRGLVLIGASTGNDPNANFFLLKTDSLGNELWRKEYGGIFRDIGRTIDLTPDGGFIIAGDKYKDNTLDSRIGYLIKTDSLGNNEWEREFGSGFDDGVFRASATTDSGYIVWGALDTIDHFLPAIPYLAKLDENGVEQWRKVYVKTPRKSSFLVQAKELANGNFLAAGELRNNVLPYAIGWLVMESPTGSTLWERFYYWNIDSVMPISFNDFIETSDGGILLTGYAGDWDEFGIGGTQFLLMKLDSNGCLINDCGLFTGIEEYMSQTNLRFNVYPNPANTYLNISYTLNTAVAAKPKAVIYNLQGQVMQEISLEGNTGQERISVSGYPSGMYIYQVVSGGQVLGSGKVVVE